MLMRSPRAARARRSGVAPRSIPPARAARTRSGRTTHATTRARLRPTDLAECDRLDEQVAEKGRLFGPGEHGKPASRPPSTRQSSSFRAPPPTTWISAGVVAVARASTSTVCACLRARLSRMQRTTAPGRRARAGPCARRSSRIARRHVAGIRERRGHSGSIERTQGRRRLGQRDELVERTLAARARPGAPALVQEPEAGDVAQQPERPADAALVREIRGERVVVDQRLVDLDPDERPGAGADVHRAGRAERHRGDGRGGVVRADRDDARRASPVSAASGAERPERRARRDDLREAARAGCRAARADRSPTPPRAASKHWVVVAFVQLGRARRRRASSAAGRGSAAASPPPRAPDRRSAAIAASSKIVLIGHELDPGALVELARGHPREHALHRARHAGDRGSGRGSARAGPCARSSSRSRRPTSRRRPSRSRPASRPPARSPSSTSRYRPQRRPSAASRRACTGTFGNRCTSVDVEPLAVEAADGDAPALGTEVHGGHRRHQPRRLVVADRAAQVARPRRRGGRAGRPRRRSPHAARAPRLDLCPRARSCR